MKTFSSLFLLALSLNAFAEVAPAPVTTPATALTLHESIEIALKNGTSVLKAQKDRELAGTQVLQGYLQFLPNLTAQGAYNHYKGKTLLTTSTPSIVSGENYGPSYSITSTLNLFNGFSDVAQWRADQDRRNAAEKTLTRAKEQITLDVAQSYLQVLLDKKIVAIADKNFTASKDRQTLLEEQTKVGARNKSDLFRQQAQTSSDENYLITAQNKFKNDLIILLRKLRLDLNGNYELSESILDESVQDKEIPPTYDEASSISLALEKRQDYDVARLNASIGEHGVTIAEASYIPKLDFLASFVGNARKFDYQNVNNLNTSFLAPPKSMSDQLKDQTSLVVGIVLTWSLFDRGVTTLDVQKNKAVAYKAELDSEDFRNQVIGEVKQALNDYRVAILQLKTSQQGLMAAQKAYEVSNGYYEVGSLSYIDLALAQTALVQAQATRAQALAGYELQKRTVEFALGSLAENTK